MYTGLGETPMHLAHLKLNEKLHSGELEAITFRPVSISPAGDKVRHKLKSSTPSVRNPRGTGKRCFIELGTPGAIQV